MQIIKRWIWPVVAGFVAASVIMMVFETLNSYFYPLPQGLDWSDASAVQALTRSLPWTAFVLVLIGWAVGSFVGGWLTCYLSHETAYRAGMVLSVLLVLAGISNVVMLGHPIVFTVVGIAILATMPYAGYLMRMKKSTT